RVDTTGNDLSNAPWHKRVTGGFFFGKRRCQCDWVIEVGIAASPQIVLGLRSIAIVPRQFAEMVVNFAQPSRMRRLVRVLNTPGEFFLCSLSLVKVPGKFRTHDTSDPVHDKNLATR